jgi:hypothetical protein
MHGGHIYNVKFLAGCQAGCKKEAYTISSCLMVKKGCDVLMGQ